MIDIEKFIISLRLNRYADGRLNPIRLADTVPEEIKIIEEAIKYSESEQEPVAWISTSELMVMRGNALGGAKDWRVNVGLVKQDGDVALYAIKEKNT